MTFREFRRLCLAQPEAVQLETWGEATFRVGGRIFAMGSPEGKSVSVKASLDDQAGLVEMAPQTFSVAAYTGGFGWVNVRLSRLSPELGARLVQNAWERTAPRRLTRETTVTKKPAGAGRPRRAAARSAAKARRR